MSQNARIDAVCAVLDHQASVKDIGLPGVNVRRKLLRRGAWMQPGAELMYGVELLYGVTLAPGEAVHRKINKYKNDLRIKFKFRDLGLLRDFTSRVNS